MPHFADNLAAAMREKNSRICVGIDPNFAKLPPALRKLGADRREIIDAFYDFTTGVLDAVTDVAACVKFQSAYFEQYHVEGIEAYFSLVAEAKAKGLLVIGDVKRGDIGATSEAYAAGHLDPIALEDAATPHAITVNPMLGLDTLEPFVDTATRNDKGLFVLVRTSNPGSAALQDVELKDGRTWSQALADQLQSIAAQHVGESGYSSVGAVVGATQPHTMVELRKRLPNSVFLLPGYGAQGGKAETAKAAFDDDGLGALVSASRSVLYAEPLEDEDWKQAIARAAREMHVDVNRVVEA
ncbi:MAG: orotidine-5'-phosphate decarboxylase [Planctomycetota bacterium]